MTASELYDFVPSTLKIAKSINGSNIVFVIDNSDTLPSNLELIKAFTIELIDIFMCQINSYSFNVISFAEAYSKLSNVLLPFCKSTATLASDWIQTLNGDTSKNTLLALGTAYTDYDVDAVIMLTDGLMTQKSPELVKCVSELSQGRALHIIYINEDNEDEDTTNFLQTLAVCTDGSLHTVKQQLKCVLEEEQVYPNGDHADEICYCSSDFSSSDESYEKPEEDDEANGEDEEDKEIKLLGKVVLAKRNSNGYYYKGTIIKTTSLSDVVVVLFESSKDKSAQLQQTCLISELIFYDDAKEEKIFADDKVLVNLDGKKRFSPAIVMKKEYIFDEAVKDDVHFTKILQVELLNGDTKTIPVSSAIHIESDIYERIVNGIKDKPQKKYQKSEENENEESKDEETDNLEDISKGLLRDKIERQLRESEEFLKSLHIKAKEDNSAEYKKSYSDSNLLSSTGVSRYPKKYRLKRNKYYYDDENVTPPLSTPKATALHSSYGREKHCQFSEPHPPVSWNKSAKVRRSACSNHRATRRSGSVGCNVVELSKKHWKGRPTTRESFPKRPFNERYIIKPKIGAPEADEYQTADGVPFPPRTDIKLRRPKTAGYLHHDIIGHRIVNPIKPNEMVNSHEQELEAREKRRITARRSQQKLRKEMEAAANEDKKKQMEAKDEQVRKAIEDRIKDEVSKLHITIEKGDEVRKSKQHKQEEHRMFERERENQNQERKHTRIGARREKMKKYVVAEEERAAEPEYRDQQVQTYHRVRSERRSEFEKNRIEKQIENHESKINRLKDLRRTTEARFRSMRKDNDNHRDIKSHVKDQQQGITRASILP